LKLREVLSEFYRLKFGQELLRESEKIEEFFILLVLSEYFGFSSPLKLLLLEELPEILEEFHRWHKKEGLENSPLEWIRCC